MKKGKKRENELEKRSKKGIRQSTFFPKRTNRNKPSSPGTRSRFSSWAWGSQLLWMPPSRQGPSSAKGRREGKGGRGSASERGEEREEKVRERERVREIFHFPNDLAFLRSHQSSPKKKPTLSFLSLAMASSAAEAAKAMKMAEQEMEYRVELFNK